MNREIKFRAWNKINKKMLSMSNWPFSEYKIWELNTQEFNEEFDILQYTGLKDKNGKEIYEGDIVKINFENKNFLTKIEYITDIWYNGFYYTYKKDKFQFAKYPANICEVIGNIYENPKLLKEK